VQNIAGLALQLEGVAKMVTTTPEAAKALLRGLRIDAEQWLRELRESIWDLRAPATTDVDLQTAFDRAGKQVITGEAVELRVTVSGRRRALSRYAQEQMIRIAQEAMRNAVRHGHATHLTMRLTYQRGKWIRVLIQDDGCGFDAAHATPQTGHCGLATMRERAEQIGAEFKIHSAPGQGTEVEIIAPIRAVNGEG
jgi:signal transduction histidine kinase